MCLLAARRFPFECAAIRVTGHLAAVAEVPWAAPRERPKTRRSWLAPLRFQLVLR